MPIAIDCRCGRSYHIKDEYAGKLVQCPHCAGTVRVPVPERAATVPQADPAFERDVFLLRQKHLAISEKYVVWDEEGEPILFIERPVYLGRSILAFVAATIAAAIIVAGIGVLAALIQVPAIQIALIVVIVLGGVATMVAVLIWLLPKRHVNFFRDESKSERLLEILQDQKFQLIVATFTVRDPSGRVLAQLRKNYLQNFYRKQWQCYAPDGAVLCTIKEDSVILALLRRLLGPLFGVLRTNFIICAGATDRVIGEFNRNFTILDRYVLDLKSDPGRELDRRVALAIGVMLDTGERR